MAEASPQHNAVSFCIGAFFGCQSEGHAKREAVCARSGRRDTRRLERSAGPMAAFPPALFALPLGPSVSASSPQAPGKTEVLAGSNDAEGPTGRSGDAGHTNRSVTRVARSLLSSVADALWADGPPQQDAEQQMVHEKERALSQQERRGYRWYSDLGLISMGLAEKQ